MQCAFNITLNTVPDARLVAISFNVKCKERDILREKQKDPPRYAELEVGRSVTDYVDSEPFVKLDYH